MRMLSTGVELGTANTNTNTADTANDKQTNKRHSYHSTQQTHNTKQYMSEVKNCNTASTNKTSQQLNWTASVVVAINRPPINYDRAKERGKQSKDNNERESSTAAGAIEVRRLSGNCPLSRLLGVNTPPPPPFGGNQCVQTRTYTTSVNGGDNQKGKVRQRQWSIRNDKI